MKHELSETYTIEYLREIAYRGSYNDMERALARALLAAHEQEPVAELENLEHFISFWKKVQEGKATPRKNEIEHTVWFLEGLASISHPAPSIPAAVPDDIGEIRVGRLPTMNQDEYPGLGEWWVQLRIGDDFGEVLARVYGDTPQEANNRAEAIARRAAMLQSETDGWIPVSERFPEPNTYVLVSNGVWVGQGAYNDSEHLEDDEHWQDEHHEFINLIHHPVTHWQPLPASPKV